MRFKNQPMVSQPPQITERFLTWCLPTELKEPVVGDLAEEYSQKLQSQDYLTALAWYQRQAVRTAVRYLWQNKRGLLMFILGLLTFLATLLMAIMFSGEVGIFINVPSILVVYPPAIFLTIGICSAQTCKTALRLLFDNELIMDITELKAAKHVYTILGNSSLWLGFMGLVIGGVAIAIDVNEIIEHQMLGPAIGISILTFMYGLIPKVICYIGEQKIQHLIIQKEA
ncbi:hypothetical protein [Planctobacterium marinum]|uniref:hypothetical protein n=1 Tax=Planctobacterium marinum TaxID=1631968 RepID=UPI001E37A110|nr:hypothetical protein [Planctobacterium marinum]MCC2604414.1 hypothetical protein [Planctobacterium marinum]